MSTKKKNFFTVKRLVIDAMLISVYVVLRYFNIPFGNTFRFTLAPFAVILCAILYGPVDGLLVGFLGEFLSQILGPYGLTQTTLLWCIGETVRGGTLGLCVWLLRRGATGGRLSGKRTVLLLVFCAVTGVMAAMGQTLALYVDSKMFGYYSYAMVFGALVWRVGVYVVLAVLMGYLSLPVTAALRKAKLVK